MRYIFGLLLFAICFTGKCEPPKDTILAYKNAIRMYYLYNSQLVTINYQDSVIQNQNIIIAIDSNIISNMSDQIIQYQNIITNDSSYQLLLKGIIAQKDKTLRKQKIKNTWRTIGYTAAGVALGLLIGIFAR